VFQSGAGLGQELLDVGHGLLRLRLGVAHADVDRGVEILAHLTANEDRRTPGHHRLAQIVVELLLRIGIAGVEFTDSSVHGRLHIRRRGNAR